jgi:hypothetical protein
MQVCPNPDPEDNQMQIHKHHAAGEPGDGIGCLFLPRGRFGLPFTPLEQRFDVSL